MLAGGGEIPVRGAEGVERLLVALRACHWVRGFGVEAQEGLKFAPVGNPRHHARDLGARGRNRRLDMIRADGRNWHSAVRSPVRNAPDRDGADSREDQGRSSRKLLHRTLGDCRFPWTYYTKLSYVLDSRVSRISQIYGIGKHGEQTPW